MSAPFTRATTGSDADPLDEDDEVDSWEQPAHFDGFMALSLTSCGPHPTAERGGQSRNRQPFAMGAKGLES
jgi:hypothetical protein